MAAVDELAEEVSALDWPRALGEAVDCRRESGNAFGRCDGPDMVEDARGDGRVCVQRRVMLLR